MTIQHDNTIVLYHGDCNDGIAAAWAFDKAFGPVTYRPMKYGDSVPNDIDGKDVYLLDFSFKRDVLLSILERVKSLSIYDHHVSAQKDLAGLSHPRLKKVVFDMERSGAGIAWDEFYYGVTRPILIDHIEDGDLWRFRLKDTKAFVEAIRAMPRTFDTLDAVASMTKDPMLRGAFVSIGEGIVRHKMQMVEYAVQFAQPIVLANGTVCTRAANVPYFLSSETGHALANENVKYERADRPPVGVTYYRDGDVWRFSLRSTGDYDVAALAAKYGGGGHKNASGFTTAKWPGE